MYTNADRQKLIDYTRETGNEIVQWLRGGKIHFTQTGDNSSVGTPRMLVHDCDTVVHTHPFDDLPFSVKDIILSFRMPTIRKHEVLCFKTAYRITIPASYQPGTYDDIEIENLYDSMRVLLHSSNPQSAELRREMWQNVCWKFGWKFEQFNPFEGR